MERRVHIGLVGARLAAVGYAALLCALFTAERADAAQGAVVFAGVSLLAGLSTGRWGTAVIPVVVVGVLVALAVPVASGGEDVEIWAVGGALVGVTLRQLSGPLTVRRRRRKRGAR